MTESDYRQIVREMDVIGVQGQIYRLYSCVLWSDLCSNDRQFYEEMLKQLRSRIDKKHHELLDRYTSALESIARSSWGRILPEFALAS